MTKRTIVRQNGHKCAYALCTNRVPHSSMYCSKVCQDAEKYMRETPAASPDAPIQAFAGRPAFNRINSSKANRS